MSDNEKRSADPVAQAVIEKMADAGIEMAYDRHDSQGKRCPFGETGTCCRICEMGPCRISKKNPRGICGADAATVVARHLIRQVAAGTAAHSDHGHDIVKTLLSTARGEAQGYVIKSEDRLKELASEWGVATDGRTVNDIAEELALLGLAQFGQQEGEIRYPQLRAPQATLDNWREKDLLPVGIEHEIVETLHRTHEGVDADYVNLLMHGFRTSLCDGWGGSMLGTDFGDVLFGTPEPVRSKVNLGVLEEKQVNIVVHGHEPTLSEMVVTYSSSSTLRPHSVNSASQGS